MFNRSIRKQIALRFLASLHPLSFGPQIERVDGPRLPDLSTILLERFAEEVIARTHSEGNSAGPKEKSPSTPWGRLSCVALSLDPR